MSDEVWDGRRDATGASVVDDEDGCGDGNITRESERLASRITLGTE